MTPGLRRATPPSGPSKPATAAPQAEPPERKIVVLVQVLDGLKLANIGAIDLPASQLERVVEAIESIAETSPEISVQVGRPGSRLIVTAVDKEDPEFLGTSENKLDLGEVITVPEASAFLSQLQPTSTQLIRYYLKQSTAKAFKKFGYTFRDVSDFKKELAGPSGKHLHTIAEANIAWAQANRREPLT